MRSPYTQCLEHDHGRLDDDLAELARLLHAHDRDTARRQLTAFEVRFERCIQAEERVLFSALERLDASPGSPAVQMRREHGRLRQLVAAVWKALNRVDPSPGLVLVDLLRSVFLLHHTKEEWVLYPMVHQATPPEPDR